MDSIFGDEQAEEAADGYCENNELPSGDEAADENLFGEDGEAAATDDVPVKVEPKQKRTVRNPRPRLTVDTLQGPRGIHTIEEYFTDIKFKGKGCEKHDLNEIMHRLQHWGHRMYPTYKFDDVLNNIERLGKKRPLQVHMSRYRLNALEQFKVPADGELLLHDDDEDGAGGGAVAGDEPFDEFDALLGEQIAISKLAPRTPAHTPHNRHSGGSNNYTPMSISTVATPTFMAGNAIVSTPYAAAAVDERQHINDSDLAQPLPDSQPCSPAPKQLTAEQLARIAENRRLAQERRRAKQQQ